MESTLDRPALSLGNQLVLGSLLLVHGRVEEAERSFTAALELARPRRWMFTPVAASAWLARIRLDQGDADAASRMAALGLDVVKRKGIWVWAKELAPVAVQALVASGLRDQARDLTHEFAAGLRGRDAPAAQAASAFCQGVVAEAAEDFEGGARSLDTAERLWLELPCPYEAAHAREQRARCMVGQADTRGGDLLVSALRTFQGLGASWDVQRVRAVLRAEGIAPQAPSQRERRAHGEALSPREAEIADLVGRGKKNREIAEALFLSPRTVEAHVAAALRKLGVESRQSLASVAGRESPSDTT